VEIVVEYLIHHLWIHMCSCLHLGYVCTYIYLGIFVSKLIAFLEIYAGMHKRIAITYLLVLIKVSDSHEQSNCLMVDGSKVRQAEVEEEIEGEVEMGVQRQSRV